ncbi:unnamed protein product [Rotaria magnacalcarata]|uniref:CRAL-TRIO domain-containing protein n=3 Tax=Rotaria magnacalcarata TaxID=392030 RepID=A0A815GVZ8_9BILA|nr:unnamed protein product [Rotaria magnacalcarata]CAF2060350.1 unnamed protein product [Rotaria magnacalcarata]CAF2111405.1 unnamed protein product [Rotaria magnacalcarata]CAF2198776.1 unnamed protein product [Rotaria magnacalcarata]CAF4210801.1 unnamed protein product [Rotaria magnacalcarata]
MASSIPQFQTLLTVEEFRKLVNKHFEKNISEGQLYDTRDLERFNTDDAYTLMFIQHGQFGTTFNEERALGCFDGSFSWRKRHNVYDISTNEFPADYFDRHAIYFKNHDKFNHPILHFVVRSLHKGQEDNEAIKRFITYHFEKHQRETPGQRIVILFDMSEAGIGHIDYDLVKFIISSMQTLYPGLLAYLLMYKMPFLLSAVWRLIRTWMSSEADRFVKFADAKSILDFIAPDQLSKQMGGTADDS